MKIIGLSGSLASGKDTVAELLAEKYGFLHMSTSDMLRAEKRRKYGEGPEGLLLRNDPFANNLRKTRGPGVLVELVSEEYLRNQDKYPGGFVASGIRSIGEAEVIKELGGTLVYVDADIQVRYGRATSRGRDRNDNQVSFDDFVAMEQSESPADNVDKSVQNLPEMKRRADVLLENNGSDIEAFKAETVKILKQHELI